MREAALKHLRRVPFIRGLADELERERTQRAAALADSDVARRAESAMRAARDAALAERDAALSESQAAQTQRDVAQTERDQACGERDAAVAERNAAVAERDEAKQEQVRAAGHWTRALTERDVARDAEQAAYIARDRTTLERDVAREAEQAAYVARDAASADRDRAREAEQVARAESLAARAESARAREAERTAIGLREDALAERDATLRLYERVLAEHEKRVPLDAGSMPDASPRNAATGAAKTVLVPVHGEVGRRELAVTQPHFVAYCSRIGADLRVVDVPDSVPRQLAIASLSSAATGCERVAIMAPGLLIREGCPDIFDRVPQDRVGVVMEGRWTDRSALCTELQQTRGLGNPLPSHRYANTGVMVMGRPHLPLLARLATGAVAGYFDNEQMLINALFYQNDTPLFEMTRDYNWVPYAPEQFDWRWSWIFNIDEYWRNFPRTSDAWHIVSHGRSKFYAATKLQPRHCRLASLIEVAAQIRGEDVRVFHSGDLSYTVPFARLVVTPEEQGVMFCDRFAPDIPVIFGPYAAMPAGRWSVTMTAADCRNPADGAIRMDVVCDHGHETLRGLGPIGEGATFELMLDRDVSNIEIRMYGSEFDFSVGAIVFRRLA